MRRKSGQIEEFLMQFNGEGIQHVALPTDDLIHTVDELQMAGIPLMAAPNDVTAGCWHRASQATVWRCHAFTQSFTKFLSVRSFWSMQIVGEPCIPQKYYRAS